MKELEETYNLVIIGYLIKTNAKPEQRAITAEMANAQGAFLVKDDRVLKGPLGSLAMFVRSHRSLRSLASLACSLACSVHGLAHSLRSLPRGTVENLEYVFTLLSRFTGGNAFFVFTRNTP